MLPRKNMASGTSFVTNLLPDLGQVTSLLWSLTFLIYKIQGFEF